MSEESIERRKRLIWARLGGATRGKRVIGEMYERFRELRGRLLLVETAGDVEQFDSDVNKFIDDFNEEREKRLFDK